MNKAKRNELFNNLESLADFTKYIGMMESFARDYSRAERFVKQAKNGSINGPEFITFFQSMYSNKHYHHVHREQKSALKLLCEAFNTLSDEKAQEDNQHQPKLKRIKRTKRTKKSTNAKFVNLATSLHKDMRDQFMLFGYAAGRIKVILKSVVNANK